METTVSGKKSEYKMQIANNLVVELSLEKIQSVNRVLFGFFPDLELLEKKLLSFGGVYVAFFPNYDHLDLLTTHLAKRLLEEGKLFEGKDAKVVSGNLANFCLPNACLENSLRLFVLGQLDTVNFGFAFSQEGYWQEHGWGTKDGQIVETTFSRHLYFGVVYGYSHSCKKDS